jgi:hypothetical protein
MSQPTTLPQAKTPINGGFYFQRNGKPYLQLPNQAVVPLGGSTETETLANQQRASATFKPVLLTGIPLVCHSTGGYGNASYPQTNRVMYFPYYVSTDNPNHTTIVNIGVLRTNVVPVQIRIGWFDADPVNLRPMNALHVGNVVAANTPGLVVTTANVPFEQGKLYYLALNCNAMSVGLAVKTFDSGHHHTALHPTGFCAVYANQISSPVTSPFTSLPSTLAYGPVTYLVSAFLTFA